MNELIMIAIAFAGAVGFRFLLQKINTLEATQRMDNNRMDERVSVIESNPMIIDASTNIQNKDVGQQNIGQSGGTTNYQPQTDDS